MTAVEMPAWKMELAFTILRYLLNLFVKWASKNVFEVNSKISSIHRISVVLIQVIGLERTPIVNHSKHNYYVMGAFTKFGILNNVKSYTYRKGNNTVHYGN